MTWQVVGCSICQQFWIVEDLRDQQTAECPICFTQHQADRLRVRFEHDDHEKAAEIRSKILAEKAGEGDAYEREDDYGELADRIERDLDREKAARTFEAVAAWDALDELYAVGERSVERATDRWAAELRFEEVGAWDALGDVYDRFEDEAEAAFQEQDTRLADLVDLNRDYEEVDHDDPETLGTAGGLSLTRQQPVDPATTITLDESLSGLSTAVASGVRDGLVDAIRGLADGRSPLELQALLDDADITTSHDDADLLGLAARIARGSKQAAADFAGTLAETAGRTTSDDLHLAPRLFALVDQTPTITVQLDDAFLVNHGPGEVSVRRSQREAVCEFLAALARGCDVRLVGTGVQQLALYRDHREDLPVSRSDITPLSESQSERVEAGKAALDPEGRAVHVLTLLADEDSETLSYSALDSQLTVSRSRRSQLVSELADLGLVDTFGPRTRKHVELLPAGRQFVDWLQSETARQRTLDDCVSEVSESSDDSREDTRTHVRGEDAPRHRLPMLHTVQPLARWDAQGAAASPPENGISVVDYPLQEQADRGSPRWYYDDEQDALVVGAEYDGPMQYWVCVARALASRRTVAAVLEDGDRLDDADLGDLLADHKAVLRDSLCLGHLPDRVADGADYLDELAQAERHLCELTRDLATDEYEETSEAEFRSTITREALGLAKTLWDVLTEVGVDVTLQIRLPRQNGGRHDVLKKERRHTLVQSLVSAVKLQARAGWSSVYRQLFETDEDRRAAAIEPSLDAFDVGRMVGSICVVGDLGDAEDSLVDELRGRLRGVDEDIHEDAPEITVCVPVSSTEDLDRTAFAQAVERMCRAKGLRPTREAVSTLRLFVATPFDAARAVHALSSEDEERRIRLSEVRYGLATLAADRVMPWEARGARRIVAGLLAADEPLAVSELVDEAEVGRSTWYDHRDWLLGLGVVVETERGYRLALAAHSDEERYSERRPWVVKSDDEGSLPYRVAVRSLGHRLATRLLDDAEVGEAVAELQQGRVVDPGVVTSRWPRVEAWLPVLRDVTESGESGPPDPVVVGRRRQASLAAAANGGVSA